MNCLKIENRVRKNVVYREVSTGKVVVFWESTQSWLSVDPMADQAPGWSPYNYCFNNPVKLVDPNGEFLMKTHKELVVNALSYAIITKDASKQILHGTSKKADLTYMSKSAVHMDNMRGTSSISTAYNNAKSNFETHMRNQNFEEAGVSLHTVADFYSHSNYIPLYQEYAVKNDLPMGIDDIPTFSQAMNNPDLMKFIEDNGGLQTGSFELTNPYSSDASSHNKMNLDKNKGKGAEPYNKNGATMHDAAKATAQKDLNKTVHGVD